MPIQRSLNQDFFKQWSPEMAYVLGYFAADGSMLKNSRGGHFIEFTSTDRSLLVIVKRVCCASQRLSTRLRDNPKWKRQYRLQIGSIEWFRDLSRLGFTQAKSNRLTFPKVPAKYIGHFVRGYFDGDGCVYFKKLKYADRDYKRWVLLSLFTSGSRDFLLSLWKVMRQNGVNGGAIQSKNRGFELKFSHRDSIALYRLMYDTAPIAGLYLSRKRRIFRKAVRVLRPHAVVV